MPQSATIDTADQSALLFKAFADPTRLRLLNLLRAGEVCVCDLVAVIDAPQPKISRHLAYLRRAGLVQVRRQGLWMYYRLAEPRTDLHRKLIDCVGSCLGDLAQFKKDLASLPSEDTAEERCCDTKGDKQGCCG